MQIHPGEPPARTYRLPNKSETRLRRPPGGRSAVEENNPMKGDEDELLGEPIEDVPKREPTAEYCRGRKSRDGVFRGYCRATPGRGTDHVGTGRCKHHGGSGGAPEKNGNAQTHALNADPKKYHERQSDTEREWIFEMTEVICDRLRSVRGAVDPLDRTLARRVAIKLHIAAHASEYVSKEGLMQTIQVQTQGGSTYEKEITNDILTELRNYDREIVNELQKLGVLDDPRSQQADATEGLITLLSQEVNRDDGER